MSDKKITSMLPDEAKEMDQPVLVSDKVAAEIAKRDTEKAIEAGLNKMIGLGIAKWKNVDEILDDALECGRKLQDIVDKEGWFQPISGKKHLTVEAWQFIGAFYGVSNRLRSIERIKTEDGDETFYGWHAIVDLVLVTHPNQPVIGSGEHDAYTLEAKWQRRDKVTQILHSKGMAQTRAISRAYQSLFRWVARLSGYEPTPAEEMMGMEDKDSRVAAEPDQLTQAKKKVGWGFPPSTAEEIMPSKYPKDTEPDQPIIFTQADNIPVDVRVFPIDQKAYADEVSSKREWRHRCFVAAEEIAKRHNMGSLKAEIYEEAFDTHSGTQIEMASIVQLQEWLKHLNFEDNALAFVVFVWKGLCYGLAQELGYSVKDHDKAFFRTRGFEVKVATADQLEAWYNFLETFGEECFKAKAVPPVQLLPAEAVGVENEADLMKLYASIRKLWAKNPDYNSSQHKQNSIREHLGVEGNLSDCKDKEKLLVYVRYLEGKVPKGERLVSSA